MKSESNNMKSEIKETKSVSFRVPTDVFDTLHDKGLEMELSAHEVAGKFVQEKIEDIALKDTVTSIKQVSLPPPIKQVLYLNRKGFKSLCFSINGNDYLPSYFDTIRIGIDKV